MGRKLVSLQDRYGKEKKKKSDQKCLKGWETMIEPKHAPQCENKAGISDLFIINKNNSLTRLERG